MIFRGRDAWRRHPIFQWKAIDLFPGIREGAALFTAFVAVEWVYNKTQTPAVAHHHSAAETAKETS